MDDQDGLLGRIDNIVSGCDLCITNQKISTSNTSNAAEVCLDLKSFDYLPETSLILKDLIFFNQFYSRPHIYKKISDNEHYIYLKLVIQMPLPQRQFYMLKPRIIQTHNFIYTYANDNYANDNYVPTVSSTDSFRCKNCDMIVYINNYKKDIIHSRFNLTCNEHMMKVVME